jgi:hypothetical protein
MISEKFKRWYLRYGFPLLIIAGIGSCSFLVSGCTTATVRVEYQDGKKTSCTATYGSLFTEKVGASVEACGASGGTEKTAAQLELIQTILGVVK